MEVLSPCPTIWKMQPLEAQTFVREEMAQVFGVANYRDRVAAAGPQTTPPPSAGGSALAFWAWWTAPRPNERSCAPPAADLRIKVAGFGGQGVLMLGEVLAEAGMEAGYEVSWLPSYGPEMRSGTSNCHVRLSSRPIDSPMVSRPNVLLAMNEPALRKFLPAVEPGGIVLYNGATLPEGCQRADVRAAALPFTQFADELGSSKVANMVMLGALLEATAMLDEERVCGGPAPAGSQPALLRLNLAALARGREQFRQAGALLGPFSDTDLWAV